MSISCCIITKNEEQNIADCISSVINFVDEIIILDTGSTDNTIEIASKFDKVKVYTTTWKDDFSKARNECVSYAKSDWILSIDADEVLLNPDQIKYLLENNNYPENKLLCFKIINQNPFSLHKEYYKSRLFKNTSFFKYVKPIHEFCYSESLYNHVLFKDIFISHNNGTSFEFLYHKNKKYIKILKKVISKTDSHDDLSYYYNHLANSYSEINQLNNALYFYKKSLTYLNNKQNSFFSSLNYSILETENKLKELTI